MNLFHKVIFVQNQKIYFSIFLTIFFFYPVKIFAQICEGNKVVLAENIECNNNPYSLIFEDNFDSDSLDLSKWKPIEGVVRDVERNMYQQWSSSKNIEISEGILKLVAKSEKILNQSFEIWTDNQMKSFTENFDYTSGEINSIDEFSYGKFEIRCKIPKGKGFFPAFWTFGGNGYNEIDVFEFWNEENLFNKYDADKLSKVHKMNNHYDYDFDGKSLDCPSNYQGQDFSLNFHTFTLIWTPYKIEWLVDGDLKRTSTLFYTLLGESVDCGGLKIFHEYILNTAFPHKKMKIIANLGIQSAENGPDNDTHFPNSLEIDYIRYYKQD